MTRTYYTYRIEVSNREKVKVERLDPDKASLGEPSGVFRYQAFKEELEPLLKLTRNNELQDAEQARKLGEILFEILFDSSLSHNFIDFYNEVVHQKEQLLRVELNIDEQDMPEVAALPWEFMCLPESANLGTVYIATAPSLVFSRRPSQWIAAKPIQLRATEKLRIALVISAPTDLQTVVYEPVQIALEELVNKQANLVELLPTVQAANSKAIGDVLSQRPHIFHFIGHGRMENETHQTVGQIALVNDLDEASWVDAKYFSDLFNRHRPGVVMLQACESGSLSASQAFVGIASRIVQQNIPVVVAMQYEVSNATASRFARCFYENLAACDPVDIAVQEGRLAIAQGPNQYQKRDFATPVIFMRVQDGYLFQRSPSEDNRYSFLKALETIRDLVKEPEVYHIARSFREDFQSACKKLNTVGDYKKLHDALHRVEIDCYNLIQEELCRWRSDRLKPILEISNSDSPDFEDSLFHLMRYDTKLKMIVKESQSIAKEANLMVSEVKWITTLSDIHKEFHQVLEVVDPIPLTTLIPQLNQVAQKINRILTLYPARINMCLKMSADDLNLLELSGTLRALQERLTMAGIATEKLPQFQDAVMVLESSQSDLNGRIQEHEAWQTVDIQLRRMADDSYRLRDYSTLAEEWELLKPEMEPLYEACDQETRNLFEQKHDCFDKEISKEIARGNSSRIRHYFVDYRSFATERFFKIDTDLKELCGKLQQRIASPLASLLEVLE